MVRQKYSMLLVFEPKPKEYNKAHAQVIVNPKFFGSNNKQKKAFKLLRISLARLATERGWTIPPNTFS